jgi:hypothetical protein
VRRVACLAVVGLVAGLAVFASTAGAARECNGLRVCVPVVGPWVVVPTGGGVPSPTAEYELSCPRGYVVGGLDAELSHRAIDIVFLGLLGSPVNPGITTSRAVVFVARYVGAAAGGAAFRPHVGCMPAAGGGIRVPTASAVFKPGNPTIRRVRTVRVRPGTQIVTQACERRERLVGASHAFGFFTRRPPAFSLSRAVTGALTVRGDQVSVSVRADAELAGIRAVVQVHALCSRAT